MTEQTNRRSFRLIARTLRIATGLILLAFVTSHLLNASLGVISVQAMDRAHPYLTGFWSIQPLGIVLFVALIVHFGLGLWSVYLRPTLRTNAQDMVQLLTALCVVPLMATHVIGIFLVGEAGVPLDYASTIRLMWIDNPSIGLLQIIVVTVVWLHGCAGLLIWLRSMERARNIVLWIYPIAIAVPVLALLGFSEAGRDVLEAAAQPVATDTGYSRYATDTTPTQTAPPPTVDFAWIKSVTNTVIWGSLVLAVLTLVARAIRLFVQSGGTYSVTRDDQPLEPVNAGLSLLDAFQIHNEPHASLCQGRGRCGTCAVRVISSEFPLPHASELERHTLAQKGLPDGTRLACQLKPGAGQVTVQALFPADYTFHALDEDPDEIAPVAGGAS